MVVDHAFVAYCDSASFGGGTFGAFLVGWLGRMGRGVVDLNAQRGSGAGRREGIRGNEAFIREQRQLLRERLLDAARAGKHPFPDGALLGDFVEDGEGATRADLEELNVD